MTARMLVLGLDGFDLTVVEAFGPQSLPNIHALMSRGVWGSLQAVFPPATLPNWTTFLTGVDPARHGVFDFTTRSGYDVRFSGGTCRKAPTMFTLLDQSGLRCACLGFPATWPPERLHHGYFSSGWDSPVAFDAERSFMWPPALYDETIQRFGRPTFDDVDEFHADSPGWVDQLPAALQRRVENKTAWLLWLLKRQNWDVFAAYFGESDTASHYLWAHHDPHSPRRPPRVSTHLQHGIRSVYETLDQSVGELVHFAGGSHASVMVLSDHGSGGSSNKVLYLNQLLAQRGLLQFKKRSGRSMARVKQFALGNLPRRVQQRLFRIGNAWLPSRLESRVRFGAIDMEHTIAFSDELNYFPCIYLNIKNREPKGIVPEKDRHAVTAWIRATLADTRDPWTGRPIFRDIVPRQELYDGPYLDCAPDLLLDLNLDQGYSYNLMPSPSNNGPFLQARRT